MTPKLAEFLKAGRRLDSDERLEVARRLLLTIPSQLGVDYNAHALESILTNVAPELGWR